MQHANVGKKDHEVDAETTPLRNPEHYQYDLNLPDIAELWRRGSVVASWLLDLSAIALLKDPQLSQFSGRVSDSGEGRWTIKAAIDEAVPANVLTTALYERFSSRGESAFADSEAPLRHAVRVWRPSREAGSEVALREMSMQMDVFADAETVAHKAAEYIATQARQAVAQRGRFVFAVSGGKTPWVMLRDLTSLELPWKDTHIRSRLMNESRSNQPIRIAT